MSQCPSCGCDCGYTKKGGCRQISSRRKMDECVMVPREPTEEMVLNGVRAFQHAYSATDVLEDWKDCYRAMIAMAPIPTREWVGLTGDEIEDLQKDKTWWEIIRAAEEILKEKNT